MVSIFTVLSCLLSLLVSLVLPAAVLVCFCIRCRKQGILSAWLLGAAGFFVTQVLIRLPVLLFLQSCSRFVSFAQIHPFLYAFSLAFTAGLFELAGRYAVARILAKNLTLHRSLAAGLGHGGIEAMLLVGISYVNNLLFIAMINSGSFDGILVQAAAAGVDTAQLELIRTQLISSPPGLFLLGGLERILAMTAHTAMSMLVCFGVARKKPVPALLLCLLIHTLLDLTAGISVLSGSVWSQGTVYTVVYLLLSLAAVLSLLLIRRLCRTWPSISTKEVFL